MIVGCMKSERSQSPEEVRVKKDGGRSPAESD